MALIRNHFLPKHYLKGFCEPGTNSVVVYDKRESRCFASSIKNVATIRGFYEDELERYLSERIEQPANRVLDKIRAHEALEPDDRIALAKYITVMWKRVPRAKRRIRERAPHVSEQLRGDYHAALAGAAANGKISTEKGAEMMARVDAILDRYASEPPEEVFNQIIPPETTPRMVAVVASMTWKFLTTHEEPAFLTCDNPVFHFESIGVGRPDSELSFPISSHIMLWATHRIDLTEGYEQVKPQIIKEMSRRVAHNADRYVFHSRKEAWILPFLERDKWKLNRIQ